MDAFLTAMSPYGSKKLEKDMIFRINKKGL